MGCIFSTDIEYCGDLIIEEDFLRKSSFYDDMNPLGKLSLGEIVHSGGGVSVSRARSPFQHVSCAVVNGVESSRGEHYNTH